MKKIFYNKEFFHTEDSITLKAFVETYADTSKSYTVNGEAISVYSVLPNYGVVEENENGTSLRNTVKVFLADFTCRSEEQVVPVNIDEFVKRYKNDVVVSVIRRNERIDNPQSLAEGDTVFVNIAGGQKGGC